MEMIVGMTWTRRVVLEATHSVVSGTNYFRQEWSFFALIGFDDHLFGILKKQTLYFFSQFILAFSKPLPLLKFLTAKWILIKMPR